jgi:hypothetical protein
VETEERTSTTWCATHPGRPAVARCGVCDRPLCLACAVPVRGEAIGAECLSAVLGDEGVPAPPERAHRPPAPFLALLGALVALAGTTLPWTRFGAGSGAFGAWNGTVRWSVVAAVAAVVTFLVALSLVVFYLQRVVRWGWFVLLVVVASATGVAAVLHAAAAAQTVTTRPWIGGWVTLGGATVTILAAAAEAASGRRRTRTPGTRG